MSQKRILLLLPAFNEEEALRRLIPEIPDDFDVLVVDSFSTDNTVKVAEESGLLCIPAEYGRGQGSSIRTGMRFFLERGYEYLVIADCDYTDDLKDLPRLLAYLADGGYDFVAGVRDLNKQREYLGLTTIIIKKVVSTLAWLLMGLRIRDVLTGVLAFNRRSVELMHPNLKGNGFEYGFEIFFNAWKMNLKIGEVDVNFRRRVGCTKFTLWKRICQVYYGVKYGMKVILHKVSSKGLSHAKTQD